MKKNITIGPFPSSEKIYLKGKIFSNLRIPIRKINLNKEAKPNEIYVYDSSGIYTEIKESKSININSGLEKIRKKWINSNKSIIKYRGRKVTSKDNGFKNKKQKNLKIFKK